MAHDAGHVDDLRHVVAALSDPVARVNLSCNEPQARRLDCWLLPDLAVFGVALDDAATSHVSWVPASRSAGHAASFIDLGPRRVPGVDVAFELEPERLERLRLCVGGEATVAGVRAAIDHDSPAPSEAIEEMVGGLRTLKAWWRLSYGAAAGAKSAHVEILDTSGGGYWLAFEDSVGASEKLLVTVRPRVVWRLLTSIFSEAALTGGVSPMRLP